MGNLFSVDHRDKANEATIQRSYSKNGEVEYLSKFAFWGMVVSYAILYCLLSASVRGMANYAAVMRGIDIWSMLMMLSILVTSCIRFHPSTLKVVHFLIAGSLFISAVVVFCLLQFLL